MYCSSSSAQGVCVVCCVWVHVLACVWSDINPEHQSPLTRYVLSFKTRNTKREIDSPWTENRVHWSTGDKRWDAHLELCRSAAGKLLYRTQATWERPQQPSAPCLLKEQQGFFLFFFFQKCGLWALPCTSGSVMWHGGEVQGTSWKQH